MVLESDFLVGRVLLVVIMNANSHFGTLSCIFEVGLPMSKFQVDLRKKWTSNLDSPLKDMPKYKILDQ